MYEKHFGVNEEAFKLLPDPRFLWYSDEHLTAKNRVLYQIVNNGGPIVLLADVGSGKTTIARRLYDELRPDESKKVSYIFAPKLPTTNAFLRFVMDEFGIKTDRSYSKSLQLFQDWLGEMASKGISPTLLIDEAQNMNGEMLGLITHLFNFSTSDKFLIQICLFAQNDLSKKLNRTPNLKSRLVATKIHPFDREQTKKMIQFRWTVAGGDKLPFTEEAITEIYKLTQGLPRSIVKLCNEALIRGFADGLKTIDKDTIDTAWFSINTEEF